MRRGKIWIALSVQIQGNDYRRCIEGNTISFTRGQAEAWAGPLIDAAPDWMFGVEFKSGDAVLTGSLNKLGPLSSSMSGYFCSYAPDFIYQHVKIPDALPPSELPRVATEDLMYAKELLTNSDIFQRLVECIRSR